MLSEVSTKFKLHMPNICAAENKYQTLFLNFFMHLTQKCAVSVVEDRNKPQATDTQWRHKSKKSEIWGWCGRQNMLRPYLNFRKFGIGIWFLAMQWRRFPHCASVVREINNLIYKVFWTFLNLVIKVGTDIYSTMYMTILVILILIVVIYIGYYIWDFVRSKCRRVEEENEGSKSKEESKKDNITVINYNKFPMNNLELLK